MRKPAFTNINHIARSRLGLVMNEYAVADLIYNLSNNPSSIVPGWCYASKQYMGKVLCLTEQTIHANLNKLIDKDLVEKHPETKYLRTTAKWYANVVLIDSSKPVTDTKESLTTLKNLESDTKETLVENTKETLDNNNNIDNNSNNTPNGVQTSSEKETELSLKGKETKVGSTTEVDTKNKVGEIDLPKKITRDRVIPAQTKVLVTNQPNKPKSFGDPNINEVSTYFLEKMQIPKEDCSKGQSRQYWHHLLRESKSGVEGVKWLIDIAAQDEWYSKNITSSKDLYYKRVKLIARKRGELEPDVAVMPKESE